MEIRTKRLLIKPIEERDAQAMCAIFDSDIVKKTYMIPDLATEEAKMKLFRRFMTLSKDDAHFVRGIYEGDILVGFLNDTEIHGGSIELGYVIAPAFHGRGYMTEALSAVINHLLENGFDEVLTGAFSTNTASIRVMEKCGMTRLRTHATIEYRGKLHDCVYYGKKK